MTQRGLGWNEYHRLTQLHPEPYPKLDQDYAFTYPSNYEECRADEIWSEVTGLPTPNSASLYLHFPFCADICGYCSFCRRRHDPVLASRYLKCLEQELRMYGEHCGDLLPPIEAIYFGGGTASLIPGEALASLLEVARTTLEIRTDADITLECNPLDTSPDALSIAAGLGINRVSFGIQSFQPELASTLSTRYRVNWPVLKAARDLFAKVHLDLIYAIPGQTSASLLDDVALAVDAAGATSISLYRLDLRGSRLHGKLQEQSDTQMRALHDAGRDELFKLGFHRTTTTEFSLEGADCKYMQLLWKAPQAVGLGLGAGAFSPFLNGWALCNIHNVNDYVEYVSENCVPILGAVRLTARDLMVRYPVLGFRCLSVPCLPFVSDFEASLFDCFGHQLSELEELGLLETSQDRSDIHLTEEGVWYVNNVVRTFYPSGELIPAPPRGELLARMMQPRKTSWNAIRRQKNGD